MKSQIAAHSPADSAHVFEHVHYGWDDAVADHLNPVERLVYRSNLLGSDQRITNTGGGNTSAKLDERDPLTKESVRVLWVKGSGGDLRTSKVANFASLYLDKLRGLQPLYAANPERGPKSPAEDHMVGYFPHCTFNLNPRPSSIDTPLHGFLPARHVDHMHPHSVIAIAASRRCQELTREVFGDHIGWVPWLRPGFELGLLMQETVAADPKLQGLVMAQHGLINWAEDDKQCYELTLSLIEKAARFIASRDRGEATFGGPQYQSLDGSRREAIWTVLLPWLRGQLSRDQRVIGTVQQDDHILRFVNSRDARRLADLGTSCPDHFLRTKIKPLYADWNPQKDDMEKLRQRLQTGLERYRRDYEAYYQCCRRADSPPMRNPHPTVILIPGLGMVSWGKNKSESRVTAEFYLCAVEVMRGAEAIDEYVALPQQEAFDIEYWQLEEAKLRRMPPERELARQVVVVVGAGSGIGKAAALRLASEGAHVVCADLDSEAADATAREIVAAQGEGIGVAGSGVSSCGPALGVGVNITDTDSIETMLRQAVLAFGGFDHLVITAGMFAAPDRQGQNTLAEWKRTFDVNVIGTHQLTRRAQQVFAKQDLTGSVVITTSVNAVVPKKGSLAYDTSKAAANHLVRELALEMAPLIRVNGIAPATVVQGSTMFPRHRVISSLTKYGIAFDEAADDDTLRGLLAAFYANRTLTKSAITPEDQAEAIRFLVSSQASKTTGQIIHVDGGLHEAFLR